LRSAIQAATGRLESGLTLLASVGATAPFVGLLGTVWGIYHALLNIASSGSLSIDKVAGPVGEALIMTAFGLGVAIPAVLAYNSFARANRLVIAQIDGFAHDLHALLRACGHDSRSGRDRIEMMTFGRFRQGSDLSSRWPRSTSRRWWTSRWCCWSCSSSPLRC